MNFTDYSIIGMAILWKLHPDRDCKWWLGLFIILVIAARLGFEVGVLGMLVAAGCWRVLGDLMRH